MGWVISTQPIQNKFYFYFYHFQGFLENFLLLPFSYFYHFQGFLQLCVYYTYIVKSQSFAQCPNGMEYPSYPDISIFISINYIRVFANGPGDLGSIPGRVIRKTQKMVLNASLLNTQHYKVRIKGKVEQSREGVAPSPTHWCSSYRKGSLRVTLDYGRQLYFFYISTICIFGESRIMILRIVFLQYQKIF